MIDFSWFMRHCSSVVELFGSFIDESHGEALMTPDGQKLKKFQVNECFHRMRKSKESKFLAAQRLFGVVFVS